MMRRVKRETAASSSNADIRPSKNNVESTAGPSDIRCRPESVAERRVLRSRYIAVKNMISDNRDEISKMDSDKFASIISEVESLHSLVQKPREQVADAEALFDITTTFVSSVKAHGGEGVSSADFVACLLREFGLNNTALSNIEDSRISINWKDMGTAVSHIFQRAPGCSTMIGPMDNEVKQRKLTTRKRKVNMVTEKIRPEKFCSSSLEEKTDTDKNMLTMFDILKRKGKIKLENLILNRTSFAQTVENIFALSFLVKDGRVEISVDNKGSHFVSPMNAPHASSVASGNVSYNHFVFRFGYNDWKMMKGEVVKEGEEEMEHRGGGAEAAGEGEKERGQRGVGAVERGIQTPIRKLSRNRGLVVNQDKTAATAKTEKVQAVVEDGGDHKAVMLLRKGKLKL